MTHKNRILAWVLLLMMCLQVATPTMATGDDANVSNVIFGNPSNNLPPTAFDVVQAAIDANADTDLQDKLLKAEVAAEQVSGIKTGIEFQYTVTIDFALAPTYTTNQGEPARAYTKYEDIVVKLNNLMTHNDTPNNLNITNVAIAGGTFSDTPTLTAEPGGVLTLNLSDVDVTTETQQIVLTVTCRMTDNGSAKNGKVYKLPTATVAAEVTVTDVDEDPQTEKLEFETRNVPVSGNEKVVTNLASADWVIKKTGGDGFTPKNVPPRQITEGEKTGQTVVTYFIEAGKIANNDLPDGQLENYKDALGVLNFAENGFEITDTLPHLTGANEEAIYANSASVSRVNADYKKVGTASELTNISSGNNTISIREYNTTTLNDNKATTPAYTLYMVEVYYDTEAFIRKNGVETQVMENTAQLAYTPVEEEEVEVGDSASITYGTNPVDGSITINQNLWFEGSQITQPYSGDYYAMYGNPMKYKIYKAQDCVDGAPTSGEVTSWSASITNGEVIVEDLPEGDYVVVHTEWPEGTTPVDTDYKVLTTPVYQIVTVLPGATADCTFTNKVPFTSVVKVIKVDESDVSIKATGAQFKLSAKDGNTNSYETATATTNSNGVAYFLNVPVGTYELTEISAPANYVLDPVAKDVVVDVNNASPFTECCFTNIKNSFALTVNGWQVEYDNERDGHGDREYEAPSRISSFSGFKLLRNVGETGEFSEITDYSIDQDGKIHLPRVDKTTGEYYTYKVESNYNPTPDGRVAELRNAPVTINCTLDMEEPVVNFYYQVKGQIKVQKVVEALTSKAGTFTFTVNDKTADEYSVTTNEAGTGSTTVGYFDIKNRGGALINYTVAEVTTGEGFDYEVSYEPENKPEGSEVASGSTVQLNADNAAVVKITNKKKEAQLTITKQDAQTLALLAGAEFTVEYPDPEIEDQWIQVGVTYTTSHLEGKVGKVTISVPYLDGRTFRVKETGAPDGYYHSVSQDNPKITDPINSAPWSGEVTFSNQKKPTLQIAKKLDGKTPTAGSSATFEIHKKTQDKFSDETGIRIGDPITLSSGDYQSEIIQLEEMGAYWIVETDHSGNMIGAEPQSVTLSSDKDNGYALVTVVNQDNFAGKIDIKKYQAGTDKEKLTTATFTITASPVNDEQVKAQLTSDELRFKLMDGQYTRTVENVSTFSLENLPIYDYTRTGGVLTKTPITYTVTETGAAEGYFILTEIGGTASQDITLTAEGHAGTAVFENEKKAKIVVHKKGASKWELDNGHVSKKWSLEGATIHLYKVLENDRYEFVASGETDEDGQVTFETDAEGKALRSNCDYIAIEADAPAGYVLPYVGDSKTTHKALAPDSLDGTTIQDITANYNAIEVKMSEDGSANDDYDKVMNMSTSPLMNYEDYVRLNVTKMGKRDETTGEREGPLPYAQFKLYRVLAEEFKDNEVSAPRSFDELEEKYDNQLEAVDGGLVYETGTKEDEVGQFITSGLDLKYVYFFRETKAPVGYLLPTYDIVAIWKNSENADTNVTINNDEKDSDPGSGELRRVQIKLDKYLKYTGADGESKEMPLSDVKFALYLADERGSVIDENDPITTFITGQQEGNTKPGRGVSNSFLLNDLYNDDRYKNYIELDDSEGKYEFTAHFVLREVKHPADVTPEHKDYFFTITTDQELFLDKRYTKEETGDERADQHQGPIYNTRKETVPVTFTKYGYVVGKMDETKETLAGVEIKITELGKDDKPVANGEIIVTTGENGTVTVFLKPNTTYTYEEIKTVGLYEFGEKASGKFTTGDDTTGETVLPIVIENPELRKIIITKKDADGAAWGGVMFTVKDANGKDLDFPEGIDYSAGNMGSGTTATEGDDKGTVTIYVPYNQYGYLIEETAIKVGDKTVSTTDVEKDYFHLANGTPPNDAKNVTIGANVSEVELDLVNPGKGSLEVTKVDDEIQPIGKVTFTISKFIPFVALGESEPRGTAVEITEVGTEKTTSNEDKTKGKATFSNLTPGWYYLTETVEEGYVGYAPNGAGKVTFGPIKVEGKYLGDTTGNVEITGNVKVSPETSAANVKSAKVNGTTTAITIENERKGYLVVEKAVQDAKSNTTPVAFSAKVYNNEELTGTPIIVSFKQKDGVWKSDPIALDPDVTYYVKEDVDAGSSWVLGSVLTTGVGQPKDIAQRPDAQATTEKIPVTVLSGNTKDDPVTLSLTNKKDYASVTLTKVDDSAETNPIGGVQFAIYYKETVNNKETKYYYTDADANRYVWTGTGSEGSRRVFTTNSVGGADKGKVTIDVRVPFGHTTNTYYIEEISTPEQYAPLTKPIVATLGENNQFILTEIEGVVNGNTNTITNATGIIIELTKKSSAAPEITIDGVEFTLYKVSSNGAETIAEAKTANGGTLRFVNLPKLTGGDYYAVCETGTPAGYVEGSLTIKKVTGDEEDTSALKIDQNSYHKIEIGADESTITLNAYNTPKGKIVVLKYNYAEHQPTEKDRIPTGAHFSIKPFTEEEEAPPKDSLEDILTTDFASEDMETLSAGTTTYTPSLVTTSTPEGSNMVVYSGDSKYFAVDFSKELNPGTYWVTEEKARDGIFLLNNGTGDLAKTQKVEVLPGETKVVVFANMPVNPFKPAMEKEVVAINGQNYDEDNNDTVPMLQNKNPDAWQTVTYRISGYADANNPHPLTSLTVTDAGFTFPGDGVTGVEYKIQNVQMIDSSKLDEANGDSLTWDYKSLTLTYVNKEKGFSDSGFLVTVAFRQGEGLDVARATQIDNTATCRLVYNFPGLDPQPDNTVHATATVLVESEEILPRMTLTKGRVETGNLTPGSKVQYKITAENVSTVAASMKNPVIVDLLPMMLDVEPDSAIKIANESALKNYSVSTDKTTDGQTRLYIAFNGELAMGQKIELTIDATVKSTMIQDMAQEGTQITNVALLTTKEKGLIHKGNEHGATFLTDQGALPSYQDDLAVGNYEECDALRFECSDTISAPSSLRLYKWASIDGGNTWTTSESVRLLAKPGDTILYKIQLRNGGEKKLTNILIVDQLPYDGDKNVGGGISRGSKWQPILTSESVSTSWSGGSGPSHTVFYTHERDENNRYISGSSSVDYVKSKNVWGDSGSNGILVEYGEDFVLNPGQSLFVTFGATVPVIDPDNPNILDGYYFNNAINNAVATGNVMTTDGNAVYKREFITSPIAVVTLIPNPVDLGDYAWIDSNADGIQNDGSEAKFTGLGVTLITKRNGVGSSTDTATTDSNGKYAFADLTPGALQLGQTVAKDADVEQSQLMGQERYTYRLEATVPEGYYVTKPFQGKEIGQDSNFSVPNDIDPDNPRKVVSKEFYVSGDAKDPTTYNEASYKGDMSYDIGLVPYRDLTIVKTERESETPINGAEFAIYGPYDTKPSTVAEGANPIATITTGEDGVDGVAKFESPDGPALPTTTYLNRSKYYVVVETTTPEHYKAGTLKAKGKGKDDENKDVNAVVDGEVTGGGIDGKNYFVLAPTEGSSLVEIQATNDYVATGDLTLNLEKVLLGSTLNENQFEFELTNVKPEEGETGFTEDKGFKETSAVKNKEDGTASFKLEYDYYTDANKTYKYEIKEVVPENTNGITYDQITYHVEVTITDGRAEGGAGAGELDVTAEVNGKEYKGEDLVFTNKAVGELSVTKVVSGNGADSSMGFNFTLTLEDNDFAVARTYPVEVKKNGTKVPGSSTELTVGTDGKATFSLKGGETITIEDILLTTTYEVTENDYSGMGYTTTVSGLVEGKLSGEKTTEVTFTNTRNVGRLAIAKAVVGNGGDTSQEFDFSLTLGNSAINYTGRIGSSSIEVSGNGTTPFKLKGGQSLVIDDILVGTTYSVSEADYKAEGYVTTTSGATSGTITTDGGQVTYTNTRNVGELVVTKTVAGNAGEANRRFNFTLTLTNASGVTIDGTYQTNIGTITIAGGRATFTLAGGESIRISGIPSGTSYTVAEDSYRSEEYVTSTTGSPSGTIGTGTTSSAGFINTRNMTSLTVTKTVEGTTTEQLFDFTISLTPPSGMSAINGRYGDATFSSNTATVRLGHGQSARITGLPIGTRYSVTEAAVENYTTTATNESGTLSTTGGATAAFTNTYTEIETTSRSVTKVWDDNNNRAGLRAQSVTVRLLANGRQVRMIALNAGNNWTHTFPGLEKFDGDGNEIVYTMTEDRVTNYTTTIVRTGTHYTITNRYSDVFIPDPDVPLITIDDVAVPLGGNINMNEGDCFN